MVDGVSAVALVDVLHSEVSEAERAGAEPWEPRPLPGPLSLLRDAVVDRLDATAETVKEAASLLGPTTAVRSAKQVAAVAKTWAKSLPTTLAPPPKTPWNRPISGDRQFAWLELPFEEARGARRVLGGTVNDLILAVLAGALGRYLRRHGQATDGLVLRVMVPVSMRRPGQEGPMGNVVSLVLVPLHVGETDPVERLRLEHEAMQQAKAEDQASGNYQMIQLSRRVPPALHALQWRLASTSAPWPANIVSTNVPGPQTPLYLAGRRMLHWYPLGVPWTTLGLFLCTLSYDKRLVLGLVADPNLVPDLWDVTDDLRASYDELLAAARDAAPERAPRPKRARKAPATAAKPRPRRRTRSASTSA